MSSTDILDLSARELRSMIGSKAILASAFHRDDAGTHAAEAHLPSSAGRIPQTLKAHTTEPQL